MATMTKPDYAELAIPVDLPGVRAWKLNAASPPLFLSPVEPALATEADAFIDWVRAQLGPLSALLIEHGGIVFRGFPLASSGEFSDLAGVLGVFEGDYAGGATPRAKVTGNVMEATRFAKEAKLPLHQEMAYLRDYPGRIAFFCKEVAEQGGETIIADMREFTSRLPADIRQTLERVGIMNVRNFGPPVPDTGEIPSDHPDQRSWEFAFFTSDPKEVEAICAAKGMETLWNEDGALTVRSALPAFQRHPVTGDRLYRAVIHIDGGTGLVAALPEARRKRVEEMLAKQAHRSGYYLGDGSPVPKPMFQAMNVILDELEVKWAWQAGDIMVLDNLLTSHGRNAFEGTRDVQAALLS